MKTRTAYADIAPYVTKDGSEIRELMHPDHHCVRLQSLAEAVVLPGMSTQLHRHLRSEEVYHVTGGRGSMQLGDREFTIVPGDTIAIAPQTLHRLMNTGSDPLVVLCCCSPPYSHDDTELL